MRLVLAGFMGTGKTAVGRRVADRLGRPFLDLDARIERRAGMPVREIFARQGEAAFRELERQAVRDACEVDNAVISTGGGTLLDEANRAALSKEALVVCLTATPDAVARRVGASVPERPLLKGHADLKERIRELLAQRAAAYARVPTQIDTTELGVEEVADRVEWELARAEAGGADVTEGVDPVRVELGERSYDIRVGAGILDGLGAWVKALGRGSRVGVLTDPEVDALYGERVRASLGAAGFSVATVQVPAGEQHKSLSDLERVCEELAEAGLERRSTLVALGGGVIGDLTGFAAATYLRGIDLVQVPTTLLAQVDSSIGGKTGVNLRSGKNLVGAFHQPRLVVADVETLASLPRRELRAGLAEVVKYAVILSPALFDDLEQHADQIEALDRDVLVRVVRECAALKAMVVSKDERESELRAILNYGHTLAHAVETVTDYKTFLHGEAVAIGMAFASRLSARRYGVPPVTVDRIVRLLERFGLPTRLPENLGHRDLARAMGTDKKKDESRVKFVGIEALGRTRFEQLSIEELEEALRA